MELSKILTNEQLKKIVLNRFFIATIDFISALIIGLLVHSMLPMPTSSNYVLHVWLTLLILTWVTTDDTAKGLMLDSIFAYTRIFKIAFLTIFGYILFFTVTRFYYSLGFLGLATMSWLIFAIINRRILHLFSSPVNGLALESQPTAIANSKRLRWQAIDTFNIENLKNIDFVLIDFHKSYSGHYKELLSRAHLLGIQLVSAAQLIEYTNYTLPVKNASDLWVQATFYTHSFYLHFKRWFDILFTLLLMPLLLLLIMIIGLLILVTMGRPVFFIQERMGMNNKPFKMIKFRTMITEAEAAGAQFATQSDARVTRLGKFLRRMRLDELPQFFNVLLGHMSIIGPRPEQKTFAENFSETIPLYELRHWVRPGITGWSQIMYGYAAGKEQTEEKLSYDMFYLKNLSFWLDMLILLKTAWIIVTGFGSR